MSQYTSALNYSSALHLTLLEQLQNLFSGNNAPPNEKEAS